MRQSYESFLGAKVRLAEQFGFDVAEHEVSTILKPHQRDIVRWMVRMGRAACFAAFGLGKSVIQIEAVRLTLKKLRARGTVGLGLIVIPLGVRQEFLRDAGMLGIQVKFIRRIEEASDPEIIYLSNYETVRDGKLDPRHFAVASLDEASCLRGFGGTKTFREFMALFAGDRKTMNERVLGEAVSYRFVATATPSPNDFIELLAYSAYLGVMDVGQAKTRFFRRNSEKADALTIHAHKEKEFWLWVSSWALFVQKPSDLGYSDEGYELPEMEIHWHEIADDHSDAGFDSRGQGMLLKQQAIGIVDSAREKRESLPQRIEKMLELRALDPAAHRLIWHDLEAERHAIEDVLPQMTYGYWHEFKDGQSAAIDLYDRHYSARPLENRKLILGPGEKMILLTQDSRALFGWRKFIDDSGQAGVNCSVFRNEGDIRSSDLIREAMAIAWRRWPGERLYTFVDPDEVKSENPGYCFLMAGWRRCGVTPKGLVILEAMPGADVPVVIPKVAMQSVYGAQDLDEREQAIIDFSEGRIRELAAKPVIAGSGCNFQRHCAWAIFLGIGFKFNDFIQAIHRVHRFQQTRRVRIDLIHTESEREVKRILEEKWAKHNLMVAKMTEIIREYGLSNAAMAETLRRAMGVERIEVTGRDYRIVNNDCVPETAAMPENSIDLVLTSVPFSTQYEYSPNYADFGHSDNNEHFFRQMDFLTPHLLRTLKPGRIAAIHVKDRIVPGGLTGLGFQTVYPFHARCIEHYTRHGFGYMGMVTIVTDVVRENNQTYRLGWSEVCKDGTKMSCGMPEYLLLFRKPPTSSEKSYADEPVAKSKDTYSRARWQTDAHGFWRSAGNRLLTPEELENLDHDVIFRWFRDYHLANIYDYEHHVKIGETIDATGRLPVTFMLLQPPSWMDSVWTDIARMRTLNMLQSAKGKEQHLCPLPFDIVDRVIERYTNPGELVYDPFCGLGTVPLRALRLKRRGQGSELNTSYFFDSVHYLKAAEKEMSMPSLFDIDEAV